MGGRTKKFALSGSIGFIRLDNVGLHCMQIANAYCVDSMGGDPNPIIKGRGGRLLAWHVTTGGGLEPRLSPHSATTPPSINYLNSILNQ